VPLVSICIPTYNRAALLARHLEHLAGFRMELEVVVSDNFSSDDTPEVVRAFERRFAAFRYIRLPGRMHPHRCWDSALRGATGDYVYALGDDDLVVEAGIAELLEFMRAQPQVLAAFGAQQLHDLATGQFLGFTRRAETLERYGAPDRARLFARHWTLEFPLMRREVYQRAVLFDTFSRFFLWSWVDAILRHGELIVTPVVMFQHYLHDKRLTHEQAVDTEWMFKVVSEIESFAATLDCDLVTRVRLVSWQLAQWYHFHSGLTAGGGNQCGARLFIRKGLAHDSAAFQPLAAEWERKHMLYAMLELVRHLVQQHGGIERLVVEDCDISAWLARQLADAGMQVVVEPLDAILSSTIRSADFVLFKTHPPGAPEVLRQLVGRYSACMDLLGSLRLTSADLQLSV
jgi:glycosyltransferase involved in cell wall biosynthesis